MSLLFLITFAGCDNAKTAKTDVSVTKEVLDAEKDSLKNNKCCKQKCEKKTECKDGKACKHKCDKDNDNCKKGKCCKTKCCKSDEAVKEHKCGEGKCGEGKCGGDMTKEVLKEEIDN